MNQLELAKIAEKENAFSVKILQKALQPLYKVKPKVKLNVIISAVVSLFIGIFLAFFLEFMRKSLIELDTNPELRNCIDSIKRDFYKILRIFGFSLAKLKNEKNKRIN